MDFLGECMAYTEGMTVTLHRCFDVCRDPGKALEQAIELGIHTILTSGQEATAVKGAPLLRQLQEQAAGRVHLMAGSGVSAGNIPELYAQTGIRHFHASCKRTERGPMIFRREGVPMGLPMASEFDRQYTDGEAVKKAAEVVRNLK